MSIEFSAEGARIAETLPEAEAKLEAAQAQLSDVERQLEGTEKRRSELEQKHTETIGAIASNQTKAILDNYGPSLQSVMALALGNKDMRLPQNPSLETCQKIAELDTTLKDSAGKPVVIIDPDKDYIDFAMLQEPDPEGRRETKGLVIGRATASVHDEERIELYSYSPLSIDPKNGEHPRDSVDPEVKFRELRSDLRPRVVVDPTTTQAVLSGERPDHEEDENTTLILVGYEHLGNVLNDIFGFEADSDDAAISFLKINSFIKQLGEKNIDFDPDFINGYLAYKIAGLEQEVQIAGGVKKTGRYKTSLLKTLQDKHKSLSEDDWIN